MTFARDLDIDNEALPVTVTLTLQCLDQKGASANADFTIKIINSGQNETVHENKDNKRFGGSETVKLTASSNIRFYRVHNTACLSAYPLTIVVMNGGEMFSY